jgi:hypothetical protein
VSKKGAFENYALWSEQIFIVSSGLTSFSSAGGLGAREGGKVEAEGARLGGISQ